MEQSKIDNNLQNRLREKVSFEGEFIYYNQKVTFYVESEVGLKFNNDFDAYHKTGFVINITKKKIFYRYWFSKKNNRTVLH